MKVYFQIAKRRYIFCKDNKKNATNTKLKIKGKAYLTNNAMAGMIFLRQTLDETE